MTRDKALKVVQRLIRLYLEQHGYRIEQKGDEWCWYASPDSPQAAEDELAAILAASEQCIRSAVGRSPR